MASVLKIIRRFSFEISFVNYLYGQFDCKRGHQIKIFWALKYKHIEIQTFKYFTTIIYRIENLYFLKPSVFVSRIFIFTSLASMAEEFLIERFATQAKLNVLQSLQILLLKKQENRPSHRKCTIRSSCRPFTRVLFASFLDLFPGFSIYTLHHCRTTTRKVCEMNTQQ